MSGKECPLMFPLFCGTSVSSIKKHIFVNIGYSGKDIDFGNSRKQVQSDLYH